MIKCIRLSISILFIVGLCYMDALCQDEKFVTQSHIFSSILGPNSEPVLFNVISLNSYELVSSSLIYSKDDQLQKVIFSPFKLLHNPTKSFIDGTKLNISQKDGQLTAGIGFSFDNSNAFSERGDKIYDNSFNQFHIIKGQGQTQSDDDYNLEKAKTRLEQDEVYYTYYENLVSNTYKITFGYNRTFFKVIGGDLVDLDDDMIFDNKHKVKADHLSIGLAYIFNLSNAANLTLHSSQRFDSAKEDQMRISYLGGSFSYVRRLFELDKDFKNTKTFRETNFIPGIYAGIAIEYEEARNNLEFLSDGINKKTIYTPFIEFKISPTNQFRLGIPIQKFNRLDQNDSTSFGPLVQWTVQIAKAN